MIWDMSTRSEATEWMDDADVDVAQMGRTLRALARINTLLGGHRTSIGGVERLMEPGQQSLSVLDVGAGGGDLARELCRWGTRRGIDVQVRGIDQSPAAVTVARRRAAGYDNLEFSLQSLAELRSERRFDVVHAALLFHHLSDEQAVVGLQKMYEICNLGVVINDLHRHWLGYLASRVAIPVLTGDPMARHDGPISVLRAFRAPELRSLVERAGLPEPQIRWQPFFRWQCVVRRA